ncbi:MAG: hypothetical protein PWP65_764 [Clostridia bacterium]|nr:hypothetical protein [Clostridia bacterium]
MKFGLALGGGGLKGAAHLGILRVLNEKGLKPDIIVGTSAGSLAAALYVAGFLPSAGLVAHLPLNFLELESNRLKWPSMGLLDGGPLEAALQKILGKRTFNELDTNMAMVATDLSTGETVVFAKDQPSFLQLPGVVYGGDVPVWEAVRASISIPGLLVPYKIGPRLLVDGGLTDNVPADIARALGADLVVAVDLGASASSRPLNNLVEVLLQSLEIMAHRSTELILNQNANLVLRPIKRPVGAWEIGAIPELIHAGAEEMKKNWPQLQRLLRG